MRRLLRQPLVLVLLALLPVLLVGGIALGGHPSLLPGFVRSALVGNEQSRSVDDAIDLISQEYYRPISRKRLVDRSLSGLTQSLDRFSQYLNPSEYRHADQAESFSGVGMGVTKSKRGLRVLEVYPGTPAAGARIRPGDEIVAVGGRSIAGKASDASTARIKGPAGTTVSLTVISGKRRRTVRVQRAEVSIPVVESKLERYHGARYGEVAVSSFTSGVHGEVRQAIDRRLKQGAKGIVLDLRGNGGGLLDEAVLMASIFVPHGTIVTTRARSRGSHTYTAAGSSISTRIPVVVLVDEGSASASEIVTGALQDHHRATVVGTRTFGKGVFQELDRLPNGGAVQFTVGEYFTPSGHNLGGGGVRRGAGIHPQVRAKDNPRTRRDEALRVALHTLAGKRG